MFASERPRRSACPNAGRAANVPSAAVEPVRTAILQWSHTAPAPRTKNTSLAPRKIARQSPRIPARRVSSRTLRVRVNAVLQHDLQFGRIDVAAAGHRVLRATLRGKL